LVVVSAGGHAMTTRLSIVTPCYNEEAVLPETIRRFSALLDRLAADGKIDPAKSGIYFVDDGSRDATWALIEQASERDPRMHGVKLSRNCGHQAALLAGLQSAPGDAIISIDADLQDDVEAIGTMLDRFVAGDDIVYGVRNDRRSDSLFKRATAVGYYRLLAWMGVEVTFNHADYRLLSRRVLDCLQRFEEVNLFLRAIVPTLGFRSSTVEYRRAERFAGESKYPLGKMLKLAFDGISSFSAFPLHLITLIGMAIFAVSMFLGVWALWVRAFGNSFPGWASTVVPMYFLGGVQLLCIGVIGEYLSKIYLEVKGRPRYFIEKVL
jgi:glycosyltransferase involved in cell wall biosynthesis